VRLALERASKKHGAEDHIYPLSLELQPGAINILLGTTRAGKTSLMRLMAGLDKPTSGRILVDGKDVTGVSVRDRDLAMVYQQFINYPAMTVFENIASPLRLRRVPEAEIRSRVHDVADRLHITPYLQRRPAELSGGQQQRTAMARALVRGAELLLLDEPLVNLDYKLREELRNELTELFSNGKTTVVYATTEPLEALQLGGYTAVLHEGRLLQYGKTLDVFNAPASIEAARAFSDPPINLMKATVDGSGIAHVGSGFAVQLAPQQLQNLAGAKEVTLGLRAHCLRLSPSDSNDFAIDTNVDLSEISGSETFVHVHHGQVSLVAQLPGVHNIDPGGHCRMHFRPDALFLYSSTGELIFTPHQAGGNRGSH
jgi:glycerol transport system ATP-binding protein